MAKISYVTNGFGVQVRCWCASCAHKKVTPEGERICTLKNLMVKRNQLCKQWVMSNSLSKAGTPPKEESNENENDNRKD